MVNRKSSNREQGMPHVAANETSVRKTKNKIPLHCPISKILLPLCHQKTRGLQEVPGFAVIAQLVEH